MFAAIVYWLFQLANIPSAAGMFFAPARFHEAMLKNPEHVYKTIGFSETAVEMVHNLIRGHGAALLAISLYLFYSGSGDRGSFLLIAVACGLTFVSHLCTMRHHQKSQIVMAAIGDLKAMYPLLVVNLLLALAGAAVFIASLSSI